MASYYDEITERQANLIRQSSVFFVATVQLDASGREDLPNPVNLSPKGGSPLHVLSPNKVAYLDYPGSGNETATHISNGSPVTLMIMSVGEDAAIVRLYGKGSVHSLDDYAHAQQLADAPAEYLSGPRQVIEVGIEKTQTSCGYGVPLMKVVRHRTLEDRGRRYKD